MGYTFVSYSRKQLYFAEAITLHLQKAGIETWFDLQQLGAGADWASTLKAGYENCERLVLVVSQAALASPYVEVEWDTALKNGREVILAVVEDVDIPEKLYGRPIFDFRGDFNSAMERLVSYLAGELPAQHDLIHAPGRFPYPLRMPLAIWATIVALTLPYLWALLISLASLKTLPASTGAFLVLGTLIVGGGVFYIWTRRFWVHDLEYGSLRYLALFALAVSLVVLFLAATANNPLTLPIAATAVLNVFVYSWLINRSAALLRWYPAGGVPQKLRRRFHGKLVQKGEGLKEETVQFKPVSFALHYHPADDPIASQVRRVFREAGHTEAEVKLQADKQLYILSNRTSQQMIEQAGANVHGDSIFLLSSSIDWSDRLAGAAKTQFVDFRENDTKDLAILAKSLSNMDAWRRQYALEATPKKFEVFDAPTGVQMYRFLGYAQAAALIGTGLAMFSQNVFLAIFSILAGIGVFFLVERSLLRKTSLIAACGFLVALLLVPAVISGQPANVIPFVLLGGLVFKNDRHWFPAKAASAEDEFGMDKDGKIKRWGRIFVAAMIAVNIVLVLLTSNIG